MPFEELVDPLAFLFKGRRKFLWSVKFVCRGEYCRRIVGTMKEEFRRQLWWWGFVSANRILLVG